MFNILSIHFSVWIKEQTGSHNARFWYRCNAILTNQARFHIVTRYYCMSSKCEIAMACKCAK